jgi:hypothetical protein
MTRSPKDGSRDDVGAVYEKNRRSEEIFKRIFGGESAEPVDEPTPELHEILGEHLPDDISEAIRFWDDAPEGKRAAILHHAANCEPCSAIFEQLACKPE